VGLASSRPGPYQNLLLQRIVLAANQLCTQASLALHPQQTGGHDRSAMAGLLCRSTAGPSGALLAPATSLP
jgi:hypothetical protein